MSRNLAIPYFPNAPREYNQQYIAEVVRAFSVYVQQVQNPGEGRNTFGVFTNLQTDNFALETGAIFNHGGYVKISRNWGCWFGNSNNYIGATCLTKQ
jgi:hypothetical protein